jgi:hypothetical protein
MALISLGARSIASEPAYRQYEMSIGICSWDALLIFGSSYFVEEWRTAGEARDIDRLMAG